MQAMTRHHQTPQLTPRSAPSRALRPQRFPSKGTMRWAFVLSLLLLQACFGTHLDVSGWRCETDTDCGNARSFRCMTLSVGNFCFVPCQNDDGCDALLGEKCRKETNQTNGYCSISNCIHGQTRPCFNGDPKTKNVGVCVEGTQTCNNGAWEETCKGEVLASLEQCNNKDDDCDGTIDNNIKAIGEVCRLDKPAGGCDQGRFACHKSQGLLCEVYTEPEICDGKDNDCNGKVDDRQGKACECNDGETRSCFSAGTGCTKQGDSYKCEGACKTGSQTCKDGAWESTCTGEVVPAAQEACGDGKDDDCDGQTDEAPCKCTPGDTQACGLDTGECKPGTQTCGSDSTWGTCTGEVKPATETCDGKDNDCDGSTDEDLPDEGKTCTASGTGECANGKQACKNGTPTCVPNTASPEICNGKDDDCDGQTDENTPGCITTLAGDGTAGYKDDAATSAQFNAPTGVAVDSSGNVYVADTQNHRIRKIDRQGKVTTYAGDGTAGFKDGSAASAQFNAPSDVALDTAGNLYVADTQNHRIRKIDIQGNVSTFAGTGQIGFKDGPAAAVQFNTPTGLTLDVANNVYVADSQNHRIRKIDSSGTTVTTYAGDGTPGHKDSAAAIAQFNTPTAIAADKNNNVYVADTQNHRIRKIDTAGNVTTLAGDGTPGYKDGAASNAQFSGPTGIAADKNDNIYVADTQNHRIRKIDTTGDVSSVAGNGTAGFLDGPFANAQLKTPAGLFVDANDNLHLADTQNHRARLLIFSPVP